MCFLGTGVNQHAGEVPRKLQKRGAVLHSSLNILSNVVFESMLYSMRNAVTGELSAWTLQN